MLTEYQLVAKPTKGIFTQGKFRFNVVFNLLLIGMAVALWFVDDYTLLIVNVLPSLLFIYATFYSIHQHLRISESLKKSQLPPKDNEEYGELKHVFITYIYKEPYEILKATITNVINLKHFGESFVVVALEERTPKVQEVVLKLMEDFNQLGQRLLITVHPYGIEGEIPGKCSNANYALRAAHQHLMSLEGSKLEDYWIHSLDTDTRYHDNYLIMAEEQIRSSHGNVIFQPLLFYNWNLDQRQCFTRMVGLFRSTMQSGFQVPHNVNQMSVLLVSLKLMVDGDFVHPYYQMEDIICYIRWRCKIPNLKIKPIYHPTLSGPTSGDTLYIEFVEWARQIRRWTIGSAEVFHYFMIKSGKIPMCGRILWAFKFLFYYCFYNCGQPILLVLTTIRLNTDVELYWLYYLFPIFLFYIASLIMIIVNCIALKTILKEVDPTEKIIVSQRIFDWLMSYPIVLLHSLVAIYGIFEVTVKGKEVCKHGASKKQNLVEIQVNN